MTTSSVTTRRGLALLLALAGIITVLAAITVSINAVMNMRQQVALVDDDDHLQEGMAAGERITLAWLSLNEDKVVLPLSGGGIPLLSSHWHTAVGDGGLTIHLYDDGAGIPLAQLVADGALRAALPPAWSALVVEGTASSPGSASDLLERIELPFGLPRFPHPKPVLTETNWTTGGTIAMAPSDSPATEVPTAGGTSLAEVVSFHSNGHINLNTASSEVLEATYRALGISDIDALLQRRRQWIRTTSAPEAKLTQQNIRLVVQSDAWNALITASWAGARRSWWVVIAGNPTERRIVQRHAIEE